MHSSNSCKVIVNQRVGSQPGRASEPGADAAAVGGIAAAAAAAAAAAVSRTEAVVAEAARFEAARIPGSPSL